jgi:hypothetical protein
MWDPNDGLLVHEQDREEVPAKKQKLRKKSSGSLF